MSRITSPMFLELYGHIKKDPNGMFLAKLKTMELIQSLSLQGVNITNLKNQMQIHLDAA